MADAHIGRYAACEIAKVANDADVARRGDDIAGDVAGGGDRANRRVGRQARRHVAGADDPRNPAIDRCIAPGNAAAGGTHHPDRPVRRRRGAHARGRREGADVAIGRRDGRAGDAAGEARGRQRPDQSDRAAGFDGDAADEAAHVVAEHAQTAIGPASTVPMSPLEEMLAAI